METPNPKSSSRVRVHGKLTVVSSIPVEPGLFTRLNSLDHAMANHSVRMVYYYNRAQGPDGPKMEFEKLRMSLCEILSMYPILTGRLAGDDDGNWRVRFTDAGVRVLRAKVGTTLDEWLRSADGNEEKDLIPWDLELPDDPHIWPPFRIQFNDFECGGLAIGLSFTHLISDPTSATLFFSSWSESHRRQHLSHPPSLHPDALHSRTPPSTATKSAAYYSSKSTAAADKTATSTATFSFSDELIRQKLLSTTSASPFNLLAALFWTRINALKVANNYPPCHSLSICIDFRKRLHAPLPYGYFGNAVYFTRLTSDQARDDDLEHVAEYIKRHVEDINEDEIWSTVDWLEARKDDNGKFGEAFGMYGPELTCINMEHLIGENGPVMYKSAFGEGIEPIHVSYDVEGVGEQGLIWVMPSPEGGMARRVKVVLREELVVKLCEDHVIRSLKPVMMISGGLGFII